MSDKKLKPRFYLNLKTCNNTEIQFLKSLYNLNINDKNYCVVHDNKGLFFYNEDLLRKNYYKKISFKLFKEIIIKNINI